MMNGLRKPKVMKESTEDSTPKSVMSSFKITFLNATLKFVKDDSQMLLSYSNMSTEQADFVKNIIDQCMERERKTTCFKGLYDPLAEALMIFSLKYDFKLNIETLGDMKKLRFEKTRKVLDTIKKEETRIIYEETTDSDSSLKQIGRSKSQKKLTTLTDAISQITPEFKLRTITELKDFLADKTIGNHTFSNLNLYQQQFISHWQALTQRVEAMTLLDVKGQMVLFEIREIIKKKNFRIKVELGMTSSQNRFAKLTKVLNSINAKQTGEEMAARLEAMVLATKARRAACIAGQTSSGDSSSDSNSKPHSKLDKKVAKFFHKTNGVKNDWIQTSLTKLRDFLQDEAQASLVIRSIAELQASFLAKWQNLLTKPAVIKAYPTDVQVLMHDVRDVAAANKKKYRVEFSLSKIKNGLRDAHFAKVPTFSAVLKNKNSTENVVPKESGNKGEVAAQKATVPNATNTEASVKLAPKRGGNKDEKSSEQNAAPKSMDIPPTENSKAKEKSKKIEMSVETAASAPKKKKTVPPVSFEPKQSGNKTENTMNTRDANELRSGSIANLYRTVCKKLKAAHIQGNDLPPAPVQKSTSLTTLGQKKSRAKNTRKLPAATIKLIEALNQPLVSERGLKMMRQMGWEGGPLGLRGEGIAEPIMPELDLGKRAGLGAPKPNIQDLIAASKAADDDTREGDVNSADDRLKNVVMQTLSKMVKGWSMKTVIECDHELNMGDWHYITNVAATFNKRDTIPDGMSAVLQFVTDEELMLTAAWSLDKTEILLILAKYNKEIDISREWGFVALPKENLAKRNTRTLEEVSAAREVEQRVMVAGHAFKYYVMAQILDFCLNCHAESPTTKSVTKDLILKGTMVKKQRSFIRDAITRINSSAPCSSSCHQDVARHNEIITAMQGKGYKMSVEFPPYDDIDGKPVYNIISLTKTYGYRMKTVLIKKPPAETDTEEATTTNNNCSTKENMNIDIQKPMKNEPKDSTKNTQHAENKENNIQIANNVGKGIDDNINDIIATLTEINIDDNIGSDQRLSKRMRPKALSADAIPLDIAHKRTKYDYVKHINIESKDYPRTQITKNMAAEIQKSIQQTIDYTQVLPLLKCHGIQNGVLSYSCHNEESLEIIQKVVKPFGLYVTLTEGSEKGACRMSLKLNTFIDESVESIFNNLETFNSGLSTKDWVFIKKEQYSDFIVIFVDVDLNSYKFIRSEHFKLYVGIDEARFSIVWG